MWPALILSCVLAWPSQAQVVIDRVVAVVNGDVITQSDLRAARTLRLVPDESDAATVQRIIDRRLALAELQRFQAPAAPASEVEARRQVWAASLGGQSVDDLLARAGVESWFVERWIADDVRLEQYIAQRFAALTEDRRAAAITAWRESLRTRAEIVYRDQRF